MTHSFPTRRSSDLTGSGGVHFDSGATGLGVGLIFCLWFWLLARKATAGVPSKAQAFVEIMFEFVDGQVKDVFHGDRRFIAPFALTIFMWVLFMNAMDLLPLDLVGFGVHHLAGAEAAHHTYRSEEHTSELQSLMRISYAVFCL